LVLFWAVSSTALATGPMFDDTPPALPFYLQRLPGKSLEEIYAETSPPVALPQSIDSLEKVTQLVGVLGARTSAELTNELNHLLVAARQDYGQKQWSGRGLVNLLHDFVDLVSEGGGDRAEWQRYAKWRLQHLDWFGFSADPNAARADPKTVSERSAELQFQLARATPLLQPDRIYLLGALGFKSGEDTRSQQWFERVVNQYPTHPRAEAALFMDGRCQLSRAWTYSEPEADVQRAAANRPRAKDLFDRYLQKYPNGRFAGDAIGWLGAIAHDNAQYLAALQYYLRQTEPSAHPELLRPALTMCEKILVRIASKPDQQAFAEVAAHPRLAMGLIYLVVNTTEADNGEILLPWPVSRDDFAAALITGFLTIVPSGMRRKTPIKTPFPRTTCPWDQAALHYALRRLNNQPPNQLHGARGDSFGCSSFWKGSSVEC
jgi:hypothetical protein